uniref:Uncharacterized protein n=1 Tax=Anguilla anguilla TaxID=7936 RepID=A0A0E9UZE1_ANGAN
MQNVTFIGLNRSMQGVIVYIK